MSNYSFNPNQGFSWGNMSNYGITPNVMAPSMGSSSWLQDPSNAITQGFNISPNLSGLDQKGMFDGMLGPNGWGGFALSGLQGLGNLFMGMKQYGIAKNTLDENKRQFDMNYDSQRRTTNAALADRQAARLAGNGGTGYMSVGEYMDKYGVK